MSDSDLMARAEARVGTTIKDKYRLEAILGVGGMATVYRARHTRNGNRVAIKILHAELSLQGSLKQRFLREGYVANSVEHRGAVRVLDDDAAEDGSVFLVMELLEGHTVDRLWEDGGKALPLGKVLRIGRDTLEVLAAAHDKGIVHRDIKPDNVFVTSDDVLKILDFGIARVRESTATATVTRTGHAMGTPAFMAPEQALGRQREVGPRTDVWAVGAMMFTLLSGRYVHEAESPEEMLVYSASRPARSIVSVAPRLPEAIVALIDRALALSGADRWPDARAMIAAIDEARSRLGPAEADEVFGSPPPEGELQPAPAETAHDMALAETHASVDMTGAAPEPGRSIARDGAATIDAFARPAAGTTGRPPARWLGLAAAGLLVVGVGAWTLASRGSRTEAVRPVDVAPALPPAAAAGPAPAASQALTALPDIPVAQVASVAPGVVAPPAIAPARPAPVRPAGSVHAAAVAAPAAAAKPNCTPNYTFDAEGNKRFKPECF